MSDQPWIPSSFKVLVSGETGTGKTYFGLTFPKVVHLATEPNASDTARANPHLRANIVSYEEFLPSPNEDIKAVFVRLDTAIKAAFALAKEGKAETLFLDNMTFLAQNRWLYIEQYEKQYSEKTGKEDTRGMYGALGMWLYKFTLTSLVSFPGNVVVSCHEQRDDDEDLKKVVDPTVPVTPNILGSFRNKVAGMFSASLYLSTKKLPTGKYIYSARCLRGDSRNAKNRYGLPELVEDVSYQKLVTTLSQQAATA